ncbi:hypothetical protein [Nostoc sp.]|uniref:hypothetical protein n=1 Tax=Nostoc sp. TaxID=1180 RepID=UPI002FFB2A53
MHCLKLLYSDRVSSQRNMKRFVGEREATLEQAVTVAPTKNPSKVEGVKVIFGNGMVIRQRQQLVLSGDTFSCQSNEMIVQHFINLSRTSATLYLV